MQSKQLETDPIPTTPHLPRHRPTSPPPTFTLFHRSFLPNHHKMPTLSTTALTLSALESTTHPALAQNTSLLLFPKAYLGGYTRTATFGSAIGARSPTGRSKYLHFFKHAVDLGGTLDGGGQAWVDRTLEKPRDGVRGDGTREEVERVVRETADFLLWALWNGVRGHFIVVLFIFV